MSCSVVMVVVSGYGEYSVVFYGVGVVCFGRESGYFSVQSPSLSQLAGARLTCEPSASSETV